MMPENNGKELEVECPLCGGKGSVETVDKEGARREMVCPVCEGRGKVSAKRARQVLGRVSGRFSRPRFFPRFGRGGSAGGRFRQPRSSVQLPLTMDPRGGSQDGTGVRRQGDGAGGRFKRPRRVKKRSERPKHGVGPGEYPYGPGTGAETGPESPADLETVLSEEELDLEELQQPEMELELAESVADEQVTREFSIADAQLEVEQPEVPEVVPEESEEATLEITHGSLADDLDYRIEPGPTDLLEDVDHNPLDDGPGPGRLPPSGDVGGLG
jgi:hypothetical protein